MDRLRFNRRVRRLLCRLGHHYWYLIQIERFGHDRNGAGIATRHCFYCRARVAEVLPGARR